ncbi:hypothetical protein RIF29_24124 [Crotalaria pallida]|uniref:Ubiquitin-like protease family profile domain-containing protein n=1 Tax=Crotalaria pallida TaxID=3830 RepID=A0AAN9EK02_CROPI
MTENERGADSAALKDVAPTSKNNNVGSATRQVIDLDADHVGPKDTGLFRARNQGKNDVGENSSPTFDIPPELTENFILQVSDDEGGTDLNNTMSTPNLKLANLYGDSGATRSSNRRHHALDGEMVGLSKNLFSSPAKSNKKPPRPNVGQTTKSTERSSPTTTGKGKAIMTGSSQNKPTHKQKSVTVPRVMKPMSKPPVDINLTLTEAKMFAFIFGEDLEPCEPIVFVVYAMKVALTQKYYSCIKTWHLPPSFAEDLKYGKTITEMLDLYKNTWMNLTPDLKFIYVPIQQYGHWYLMVVSIPDRTVYHVDSYLPDHDIQDKQVVIRNVRENMHSMMTSDVWGDSGVYTPYDLGAWPIDIARGYLTWALKEMNVRIKTALMMAMDPFNQKKIEIEEAAGRRWEQFA